MAVGGTQGTAAIPNDGSRTDDTRGFGVKIPFAEYIGLYVTEQTTTHSMLRVEPKPELINSSSV